MKKDEAYFDKIFQDLSKIAGGHIPSVSQISLVHGNPFAVLVSTVISLRTRDNVTLSASSRILKVAPDAEKLSNLSEEEIQKLIYPAGFYKRKATQLKKIGTVLFEQYNNKVPSSSEELLKLPGVGIKTANLTLSSGFGINTICVDCHVHQIANRLGWINTKTPEESVEALKKILPEKYWIPINELLVTFGQNICTSVSPFCSKCPEKEQCPKIGVTRSR